MGLLYGKNFIILTSTVFYDTPVWQTDRRTDGRPIAYTRYSIYAVARKNYSFRINIMEEIVEIRSSTQTLANDIRIYIILSVNKEYYNVYSVSQKYPPPPPRSWHFSFFHKRLRIFNRFLHTNYTFLYSLDYKFLFNYIQLWRSYGIGLLSATVYSSRNMLKMSTIGRNVCVQTFA